jgi:hypothetical protein
VKAKYRILRFLATIGMAVAVGGCSTATPTAAPASLTVKVLYPTQTDRRQMGDGLKSIIQVLDQQGQAVSDARVSLSIIDPSGEVVAQLPATFGSGEVYRTEVWKVPHRTQAGQWAVEVTAQTDNGRGSARNAFQVKTSIGEQLLAKYGFWADAPTLKDIKPDLFKEKGDARNGVIVWGGLLPVQHIYVENWLEVQWREGDFHLSSADDVRSFIRDDVGDIGFYPVRAIGPFEKVKFKNWDAWQVKGRGQYSRYDQQWMIFYAPEAGKTYVIGTMVVLPPTGIDPHAALRDGFEVHPEVNASGTAPIPLQRLLPAPELSSPALGTRVMGAAQPIVLQWQPLKTLGPDEFYRVRIDYDYSESNTSLDYWTQDTQMVLPPELYNLPNCGVFNWTVTLMQKTGTDKDGQPEGTELSYGSLYWYVEWIHPVGEPAPFQTRCPNPLT